MIRGLLLFALLLVSTNTNNVDLAYFDLAFTHSQCSTPESDVVHMTYNHLKAQSAMDYAFAARNKETGHQEIVLHYETFGKAPTDVREWVFYHECGHHILGHTTTLAYFTLTYEELQEGEEDADCFAAREFMQHHSRRELGRAMIWLNKKLDMSRKRIKNIMGCKL